MTLRVKGSRRSRYSGGTQEHFGTGYQWDRRSPSDRSGSVVPTGTGTGSAPGLPTGTGTPLRGWVPVREAPAAANAVAVIEHVEPQLQDADVKELPASLLPAVPLPVTLCCLHSVFERGLYLSFDRAVWEALKRRKEVVFGVLEWSALVSASSYERANAASFAGWCEAKAKQPTWKLQLADAIGCVIGETESRDEAQTVGAVLRSWGCTLQRVHYGKDLLT